MPVIGAFEFAPSVEWGLTMAVVTKLLSLLGSMRRLFSRNVVRGSQDAASVSPLPSPALRFPAVAGYVKRVVVDRFFLASRIASVSRLNTPVGRKPRIEHRATKKPAIPSERLGAKKVRAGITGGLRIMPMIEARRSTSAEIIPFPARRSPSLRGTSGYRKAA